MSVAADTTTLRAQPQTRTASASRPKRNRRTLVPTLVMSLVLAYCLIPLVWLIFASTKTNSGLFESFGFWFADDVRPWQNIKELFAYRDGVFAQWMLNSAMYSIVSAGGASIIATIGGYAFSKFQFKGKRFLYAFILGSIMVPTTALAIPTYLLFARVGIVDTPMAVILPSLVSPFGIFLMKVYTDDAVPDSVIESARVDGASELRIFTQIAFRMLTPAFITVLLFAIVTTWNNYFLPLVMLNSPEFLPVTIGLAQLNATANAGGGAQPLLNLVVTGSLVSIIPLIAAFVLLQRFWQSGLASGAAKE
ncbi:MAG TPA: carbohydrate ABC transporter permease [Actinoplanes sp.]|jgi:multiple sugar transport system permease protein